MATFTWKNAKSSGLWTDGANWVGGAAPNSTTDIGALNAAGPYSVTIPAGSTITAQGVQTVTGVTLDIAGTFQATVPSAFLTMSGGGLLDVTGTLHANGTGTYIFLNNLALANLSSGVLSGGTFAATGQPSGGSVATIDVRRTGQDSSITTLDATVVLRHVNSTIQARDAGGIARSIDTTLTSITPDGDLQLLGGRGLTINQALTVNGRLLLESSKVSSKAGLTVASGGTVQGSGTISSALALSGTVRASAGTLALSGGVVGAGTLVIDSMATLVLPAGTYGASLAGPGVLRANAGQVTLSGAVTDAPVIQVASGATIDLGGAGAATLAFAGTGGKLAFEAAGFTGSIVGFQTGNVLQVKDVLATGASIAAAGDDSLLTLATAGGSVSFRLSGDYSTKTATVAPDGSGGTNVTVAGVSFVPEAASWGSSTITWSFAQSNLFGSVASFSGFVNATTQADLAALWRAAFARWSEVSGLSFVEVADATSFATQADIRVGWGNFGNPPADAIGQASFSFIGGTSRFVPGTLVRLQDPSITPLVADDGVLVYQGTVSSAYQIMLHEIGHALGLDHTASAVDPAAVMNPAAGEDNRDLDISDIAGIRAIYAGRIPAVVAPGASLSIAALDANRAEGQSGTAGFTFTVTRSGDTAGSATASYAVTGSGPAPAGAADFAGGVLPGGTVSFAPGQTSQTLTIPIVGDSAVEANEGFTVTLSAPSGGATIGTAAATGTIANDDASLSIAALDADRAEGQSGTAGFTFTVTRSGDSAGAHSVAYAVSGADAADFAGGARPAGIITFAAGQTSQTLAIPVAGDSAIEADEGFTVTLSAPSAGATLGSAAAAGTIRNDDAALSIAALLATRAEGQAGTTGFTFTVTRSGTTAGAASADWAVSGASAADFDGGALPAGTISFAPGQTSRILTIDIIGDTTVEPDEGFAVTLSNPTGATLAAAAASGTILNDDASVSIAAAAATLAEGNGGSTGFSFTLTRSGNATGAASVAYAVTGSGADPASADDFAPAALPAGIVTFGPGETSRTLTIPVAGDGTVEADEGFTVTLSAPAGATLGTAAAGAAILNDDVAVPATLSVSRLFAVRSEGQSGATDFTFLVTRGGDTAAAASAAWATTGGGAGGTLAASGADFFGGALPAGTVTFAPGETSAVITVQVAGDTANETNDSFTLTLSGASPGTTIAAASAVGIIYNDDSPGTGTLSIARANATRPEGASGATPFTFTVSRSGSTTGSASADWSVSPGGIGGTAAIDAADIAGGALPSGRANFAVGQASQTVTVNIAGDGLVEPDESFTVTLSGTQAGVGIATAAATGLVQNDDIPGTGTLAIARLHAARAEGQAGTTAFSFLVSRSGDLTGPARANWAVSGGTIGGTVAANAADFGAPALPAGSVSFAPGQASQTITVTVAADSLVELNESFTVTLSGPAPGVEIATSSATGLIFNDDSAGTGTLAIARLSAQKNEGHAGTTPLTFTVTRSGDISGSASADWAVTGGGAGGTVAANGADFPGGVLPNGRVNFAAGQSSQIVTVNAAGDGLIELNESFTITLAAPQAGVAVGTASATGVMLNDDFPPSGTLSIAGLHAARGEGAGGATPFTFAVTRTGSAAGPASADWSITGGGLGATVGTNAGDFVGGAVPSGTVSFAPGQTSAVITVEIAGDTASELNESFTVTLSAPPAGVTLGTASAAGLVWNDDPAGTGTLSIAATGAKKAEGHAGTTPLVFAVTRSGDASGAAGADWIATGGGAAGTLAANGADFLGGQLPAGRVQFAAGQTTQLITVNVAGDTAAELNESFTITLLAPQPGVAITVASAVGVILNDDFASSAANQALTGTDAADLFLLGGGLDTVTGKGGTDLFLFQPAALGPAAGNATTLADFSNAAGEELNLAAIDANAATGGDDPFAFIGTAAFSLIPGQLRWEDQGSQRLVQGDTNGDGIAELTVFVKAAGPVDARWFVL